MGSAGSKRPPLPVYVIALAIFGVGTSEFMVAGLLPELAANLDVSIPAAGTLISAFAIGMVLGAPTMALLTLRLPRKTTLALACAVFAAVHVVAAMTHSYHLLLATRVVAAFACATVWAVGMVSAVSVSPPGATARALSVVLGGLTLSNILGVPAGALIGEHFGWRATFAAVAVLMVAATTCVLLFVPETGDPAAAMAPMRTRLRGEIAVLARPRIWAALATATAFQGAIICAFAYLAPLLTDVSGLPESRVPIALLMFGVGTFLGIAIGGRYADRNPLLNVFLSLATMSASLILLAAVVKSPLFVVGAVLLLGMTSFSIASAMTSRLFHLSAGAPTLAMASNVSASNIGSAIGPWLGGLAIAGGLGYVATVWIALGMTGMAIACASASYFLERTPARSAPEAPTTA